jgi:hypothetical protein
VAKQTEVHLTSETVNSSKILLYFTNFFVLDNLMHSGIREIRGYLCLRVFQRLILDLGWVGGSGDDRT